MTDEQLLECSVCGLTWRNEDLALNCCRPGLIEHERGSRTADRPAVLDLRCGGVALVYDLPLLTKELNELRGDRKWNKFCVDVGVYGSFFCNIVNQHNNQQWIRDELHSKLMELFGDPVPGTMYWPPELSLPVGGIPRRVAHNEAP